MLINIWFVEASEGCGHPWVGFSPNLRFLPTVVVGKATRQRIAASTRTMEHFMVFCVRNGCPTIWVYIEKRILIYYFNIFRLDISILLKMILCMKYFVISRWYPFILSLFIYSYCIVLSKARYELTLLAVFQKKKMFQKRTNAFSCQKLLSLNQKGHYIRLTRNVLLFPKGWI